MDKLFDMENINCPFIFKEILNYNGENFIEITQDVVPGILPKHYYVNIRGEVYSTFKKGILSTHISPYGYKQVTVKCVGNVPFVCKVHRLIMLTFNHIPGCEELVVNHLDTNKLNNNLNNLEWTTIAGNNQHAFEHGLSCIKYGEENYASKLTTQQVHEICQRLSINPHQSISALAREYGVTMGTIRGIAVGDTWQEIRSQYNINYIENYGRLTPDMVEEMCKIFEKNAGMDGQPFLVSYREIVNKLGIEDTEQNIKRIRRIYNKEPKNYPYITCKYSY